MIFFGIFRKMSMPVTETYEHVSDSSPNNPDSYERQCCQYCMYNPSLPLPLSVYLETSFPLKWASGA